MLEYTNRTFHLHRFLYEKSHKGESVRPKWMMDHMSLKKQQPFDLL